MKLHFKKQAFFFYLLSVLLSDVTAQSYSINTYAGGHIGDGGLALSAPFGQLYSVAVDDSGNLFIADQYYNRIRKVNKKNGIVTTVAGTGGIGMIYQSGVGYSGDGGPATAAELNHPIGVALDRSGNIYIADANNNRIRKVNTSGIITTVAGNGTKGYSGDNGPAINAELNYPNSVYIDSIGNVYIDDLNNNRIRKINTGGTITTIVGNGIAGFSGDGGLALTAELNQPTDIKIDKRNNLYIADQGNNRVRKVGANDTIITVAGNDKQGYFDDGGLADTTQLNYPYSVAVDDSYNIYITDEFNHRVRKIDTNGIISTFAGNGVQGYNGNGGMATAAWLNYPSGVITDHKGNVYIADADNSVIREVSAGIINTVAGNGSIGYCGDGEIVDSSGFSAPTAVTTDDSGNIYICDLFIPRIIKVDKKTKTFHTLAGGGNIYGDGGPATAAKLGYPTGIAVDNKGNVYIADANDNRIRKINTTGIISTIAGKGFGYTGDGGPATNATLGYPTGVAVDKRGNIYIADQQNSCVREIDSMGIIRTIAGNGNPGYSGDGGAATSAELYWPWSVAVDDSYNIYVADNRNNRIRMVKNGIITTIAGNGKSGYSGDGGPATSAEIYSPDGVTADNFGNVYITNITAIRKISNSIITSIAGNGTLGFSGDGGPADSAQLNNPYGVFIDNSTNDIYIADYSNQRIRVLTLLTGINELSNVTNISVYPNPGTGVFNFQFGNMTQKGEIEIYNMLGKRVYSKQLSIVNSQLSIDISNQPAGIYLYRIVAENGSAIASGKLVIQ